MGKKKRTKTAAYVQEALDTLLEYLKSVKTPSKSVNVPKSQITQEGFLEALMLIPEEDRKAIERFWGLNGGVNHSKKPVKCFDVKDKALLGLRQNAYDALRKMSKLEVARIYDLSVDRMVEIVNKKVNKEGISNLTDYECAKYLIAFFLIIDNGPKFPYEEDDLQLHQRIVGSGYLDEYVALMQMCEETENIPDYSINLKLIKSLFEMFDFKEWILVKKNFGITSFEALNSEEIELLNSLGINANEIIEQGSSTDLMYFEGVRAFKERVFKYAGWDVAVKIIAGEEVDLSEFETQINNIPKDKDWISGIEGFKTSKKRRILTSKGFRNLDIYCIGGLDFTDPVEIDFLKTHLASA